MLIGEYLKNVGNKFRVAFPKKFRDELGDELIITKGYEKCLIIIPKNKWEEMVKENIPGPFTSGIVRDTSRFLLGSASEIELDSQGRFVIPIALRDYSNIGNVCVFVGLGKWIELWNESDWEQKKKEIEKHSSIVGDKLASIKIDG